MTPPASNPILSFIYLSNPLTTIFFSISPFNCILFSEHIFSMYGNNDWNVTMGANLIIFLFIRFPGSTRLIYVGFYLMSGEIIGLGNLSKMNEAIYLIIVLLFRRITEPWRAFFYYALFYSW
jgi:hypothetical protein